MWVTAVSCRNMIPDPGFFLERLRAARLELLAAVDAIKLPALSNATPKVAKQAPAGQMP